MNGKKVGYTRVSSHGQNTERQLDGVKLDKVFTEKISGKSMKRPELEAAMAYLRDGDQLHVHSIDRLARNLRDLLEIIEQLVNNDVSVHFHKENLVFSGDDSPMSRLMLQMMGSFAEFERSLIRERQLEGIAAAQRKGKRFGQPPKLSEEQVAEVRKMAEQRRGKTEIAEYFCISRQTVYNILRS